LSVAAGQQARSTFAVTPINGWNATASVAVQQVDAFPGTVYVTPTATTTAPAVLTVIPAANAAVASYRLNVVMTSGSITSSAAITITVQAAPVVKRRAVRR
ncbi:MAG TPA: hypothetical protein VLU46_16845, partial [Thermoanaerobaculia bacterium]|nr:hypothetical protein [Thermoanaerobaculia bacterium]